MHWDLVEQLLIQLQDNYEYGNLPAVRDVPWCLMTVIPSVIFSISSAHCPTSAKGHITLRKV